MTLLEYLQTSGLSGLLILALTGPLAVWAVVSALRSDRPPLGRLAIAAALLVAIGALGTALDLYAMQQVIATSPTQPSAAELTNGRMQAISSSLVGLSCAALVLGAAGLARVLGRGGEVAEEAQDLLRPELTTSS